MQKLPKQHPASFRSRLFICRGVIVFHESKTSVFQILKTAVFRNPHSFANSSKTTRFLLRFDYDSLPQLAAFCTDLPFQPFFMAECDCRKSPDYRGKSRHCAANQST
jgi:hypothetical protein